MWITIGNIQVCVVNSSSFAHPAPATIASATTASPNCTMGPAQMWVCCHEIVSQDPSTLSIYFDKRFPVNFRLGGISAYLEGHIFDPWFCTDSFSRFPFNIQDERGNGALLKGPIKNPSWYEDDDDDNNEKVSTVLYNLDTWAYLPVDTSALVRLLAPPVATFAGPRSISSFLHYLEGDEVVDALNVLLANDQVFTVAKAAVLAHRIAWGAGDTPPDYSHHFQNLQHAEMQLARLLFIVFDAAVDYDEEHGKNIRRALPFSTTQPVAALLGTTTATTTATCAQLLSRYVPGMIVAEDMQPPCAITFDEDRHTIQVIVSPEIADACSAAEGLLARASSKTTETTASVLAPHAFSSFVGAADVMYETQITKIEDVDHANAQYAPLCDGMNVKQVSTQSRLQYEFRVVGPINNGNPELAFRLGTSATVAITDKDGNDKRKILMWAKGPLDNPEFVYGTFCEYNLFQHSAKLKSWKACVGALHDARYNSSTRDKFAHHIRRHANIRGRKVKIIENRCVDGRTDAGAFFSSSSMQITWHVYTQPLTVNVSANVTGPEQQPTFTDVSSVETNVTMSQPTHNPGSPVPLHHFRFQGPVPCASIAPILLNGSAFHVRTEHRCRVMSSDNTTCVLWMQLHPWLPMNEVVGDHHHARAHFTVLTPEGGEGEDPKVLTLNRAFQVVQDPATAAGGIDDNICQEIMYLAQDAVQCAVSCQDLFRACGFGPYVRVSPHDARLILHTSSVITSCGTLLSLAGDMNEARFYDDGMEAAAVSPNVVFADGTRLWVEDYSSVINVRDVIAAKDNRNVVKYVVQRRHKGPTIQSPAGSLHWVVYDDTESALVYVCDDHHVKFNLVVPGSVQTPASASDMEFCVHGPYDLPDMFTLEPYEVGYVGAYNFRYGALRARLMGCWNRMDTALAPGVGVPNLVFDDVRKGMQLQLRAIGTVAAFSLVPDIVNLAIVRSSGAFVEQCEASMQPLQGQHAGWAFYRHNGADGTRTLFASLFVSTKGKHLYVLDYPAQTTRPEIQEALDALKSSDMVRLFLQAREHAHASHVAAVHTHFSLSPSSHVVSPSPSPSSFRSFSSDYDSSGESFDDDDDDDDHDEHYEHLPDLDLDLDLDHINVGNTAEIVTVDRSQVVDHVWQAVLGCVGTHIPGPFQVHHDHDRDDRDDNYMVVARAQSRKLLMRKDTVQLLQRPPYESFDTFNATLSSGRLEARIDKEKSVFVTGMGTECNLLEHCTKDGVIIKRWVRSYRENHHDRHEMLQSCTYDYIGTWNWQQFSVASSSSPTLCEARRVTGNVMVPPAAEYVQDGHPNWKKVSADGLTVQSATLVGPTENDTNKNENNRVPGTPVQISVSGALTVTWTLETSTKQDAVAKLGALLPTLFMTVEIYSSVSAVSAVAVHAARVTVPALGLTFYTFEDTSKSSKRWQLHLTTNYGEDWAVADSYWHVLQGAYLYDDSRHVHLVPDFCTNRAVRGVGNTVVPEFQSRKVRWQVAVQALVRGVHAGNF